MASKSSNANISNTSVDSNINSLSCNENQPDNTNTDTAPNTNLASTIYKHYIKRAKKLIAANFASLQSAQDIKIDEFNHLHSFYNKKSKESKKLHYVDLKRVKYSEFKLNEQRVYALNYLLDNNAYAPIFLTITLPSEYHPFKVVEYAKNKKQTPIYDKNIDNFGYECFKTSELKKIVQKGYDKLNNILRHINKQLSTITNGNCYYVNAIEPHKTFIPHAHCIIYVPIELRQKAIDYIAKYLSKNGGSYDIKALLNDSKKASSYLIKYINKTFNDKDGSILGYYYLIKMRPFRISNLDRLGLLNSVDFSKIYKSISKAQKDRLVKLAIANNTNLYIEVSKNCSINQIKSGKLISIFKRQSVKTNSDNLKIKSSLQDMLKDSCANITKFQTKLDKSITRVSKKALRIYNKISNNQDIVNGILGNVVATNNTVQTSNFINYNTYSKNEISSIISYHKLTISKALHQALTHKDMVDYFKQVKKDILADLFDTNKKIRLNRSCNRYKIFFDRKIIYNLQDSKCLYLYKNSNRTVEYSDEIINKRFYKNLGQPTHFSSYEEQDRYYAQKRLDYARLEDAAQSGDVFVGGVVLDF